MSNYFQANEAVKVFTEYKRLTLAYWKAQPKDRRTWMTRDLPAPQNEESRALREKLMHLYPEANTSAHRLGIAVTAQSFPAPMIGGPVLTVNLLYGAIDQDQGHSTLSTDMIMDNINNCLAAATAAKKKLFWHQLLNPVWWFVEIVAYILRIPFMILRRAGVSAKVEESIWGNIVKVLFFIALIMISIYWSLDISAKDLLHFVK